VIRHVTVGEGAAAERLDVFLAKELKLARSRVQKLLAADEIRVNGASSRPSYAVQSGDSISVSVQPPEPLPPSDLQLPILYEDDDVMVVNKPAGLTVHPGNTRPNSLVQPTVAGFMATRTSDPDTERPGIVHRLDRDTSGLLVLAKSAEAKAALQQQFRSRTVHKTYLLLTVGHPDPPAAEIRLPTGRHPNNPLKRTVITTGRPAVTRYRTLSDYQGYSLVEAKPETGRTHQLRVHFAAIGHPVAGDTTYGSARRPLHLKRQFLHAAEIEFTTPAGRRLHLSSPLPADLESTLQLLAKQV
jgi:23S rRNA pseudouridine1911/1915/1917 synthase